MSDKPIPKEVKTWVAETLIDPNVVHNIQGLDAAGLFSMVSADLIEKVFKETGVIGFTLKVELLDDIDPETFMRRRPGWRFRIEGRG